MKGDIEYLFLSSNYRKLYQEDVFNAISFPTNYIIQYRYDLKYLDEQLSLGILGSDIIYQETLDSFFKNKNCILGYLHKENDSFEMHAFRKGKIRKAVFDSEINRLLIFIELKEFMKLTETILTKEFKLDIIKDFQSKSTCIFSLLSKKEVVTELSVTKFHDIAQLFSTLIPAKLFFSLSLKEKYVNLSNNSFKRTIHPVIDPSTNLSRYSLKDGSNYFFEILTFEVESKDEFSKERSDFEIESSSEYIYFNQHILNSGSLNLNFLDLVIQPIPSETINTSIKFEETQSNFITNILIDIKKSTSRSLLFAFSSFLVLITVPSYNLFVDQVKDESFTSNLSVLGIPVLIFSFLIIFSLNYLYRFFDKK